MMRLGKFLCIVGVTVFVIGCSSDDDNNGNNQADEIFGTAATGAAIEGTVEAIDAEGTITNTIMINDDGSFTIATDDLVFPLLVCAENESAELLCSFASGNGRTNINPLTDLTLFLLTDSSPSELIASWSTIADTVTEEAIDLIVTAVNANLEDQYLNQNINDLDYDYFNTAFTVGDDGFDEVLDQIVVEIDPNFSGNAAVSIEALDPDDGYKSLGDIGFDEDLTIPIYQISIVGSYYDVEQNTIPVSIVEDENIMLPTSVDDVETYLDLLIPGSKAFDGGPTETETYIYTASFAIDEEYYTVTITFADQNELF